MSTVVNDTDKPITRTDQLAEISQKLDLMAQSIGVLGAQVNYLLERADIDRRDRQLELRRAASRHFQLGRAAFHPRR